MNVNIRTRNNIRTLLAAGQSGNWGISPVKEVNLTQVRIFNWEGTEVLIGDYDPSRSVRLPNGLLVVGFVNGRIVPCDIRWFVNFNRAPFVYSDSFGLQNPSGIKIGVVRDLPIESVSKGEIRDIFRKLIAEIKLLGINKIVFRKGGIPIPDFFRDWCQRNGVVIEILDDQEMDNQYPRVNDIPPDIFIQIEN